MKSYILTSAFDLRSLLGNYSILATLALNFVFVITWWINIIELLITTLSHLNFFNYLTYVKEIFI